MVASRYTLSRGSGVQLLKTATTTAFVARLPVNVAGVSPHLPPGLIAQCTARRFGCDSWSLANFCLGCSTAGFGGVDCAYQMVSVYSQLLSQEKCIVIYRKPFGTHRQGTC